MNRAGDHVVALPDHAKLRLKVDRQNLDGGVLSHLTDGSTQPHQKPPKPKWTRCVTS
jgi:hypothetical protein